MGDAKINQLVIAVLNADVVEKHIRDNRPVVVVDGKHRAVTVDMENVNVGESDVANKLHRKFVADFHGIATMPVGERATPDQHIFNILAGVHLRGGQIFATDKKRLHHHAIVIVVEKTVFDDHVARANHINAIGTDDLANLLHVPDGRARTSRDHQHPALRPDHRDIFHQHFRAALHRD